MPVVPSKKTNSMVVTSEECRREINKKSKKEEATKLEERRVAHLQKQEKRRCNLLEKQKKSMLLHYEVIHIITILGTVSTAKRRGQGTINERGIIIMIISAIHIILLIRYCFYSYCSSRGY